MMQLVWFRNDLRIQDHSALYFAQQNGPCIGCCYLKSRSMETSSRMRLLKLIFIYVS